MLRLARLLLAALSALLIVSLVPATDAAASTPSSLHTSRMTTKPSTQKAASRWNSANWAGYQVSVNGPLQAHASWYVPSVSWPGRDGYSTTWVGIGGGSASQGQLLQAGTEHDAICAAVRGRRCVSWRTQYYAWIETYPQRGQERVTNLVLAPGDAVEATVRWDPAQARAAFTLCNWRTSQCVSTSRRTSAPRSVAQFVVERPTLATGRMAALANFGAVSFTGLTVTNSRGSFVPGQLPNARVSMANGRALATPGALTAYGDSFRVAFDRPA